MSLSYGVEEFLSLSSHAVISGLQNRPELNGGLGTILKFVKEKERYHIQATFGVEKYNLLLKKNNLIFVSNIHELIHAQNVAFSTLPWLLKGIGAKKEKLDDDAKYDEIQIEELNKSDIVLIHGLINKPEFNNLFAEIVYFNNRSKRYHIKFEYKSKVEHKSMKSSNLQLIFPFKYREYTATKCVTCSTPISSPQQLLTCPGCASLNYCRPQCRNKHLFAEKHLGQPCYIYRCNMLYNVSKYKYILYQQFTPSDMRQFKTKEIADYKNFCHGKNRKNTSIKTNIRNWEDWMKHFGFDYEICNNHSHPMSVYHILKQYFLKYTKFDKKTININLVGCSDAEFAGIEFSEPMIADIADWKWRWKMMAHLLEPLKINITCYGDELNEHCANFKSRNLAMSFKRGLYLPNRTKLENEVDIVIGLNAGIHEHKNGWVPVIKYCVQNKIAMMFTEYCMVEYELYIRHLLGGLVVQNNLIVAFNQFRDPTLALTPFTRRICSPNTLLYGTIKYD